MNTVTQLYPLPPQELPLRGLYLGHDVRRLAAGLGRPLVYANFVVSLDGRIAVPGPTGSGLVVPKQVANSRDWRLFQELAVQADVVISSGRYLRDYASGHAQEILRVYDDPQFADLAQWRVQHGLSPQPDIAVISASLDFPIPEALLAGGRRVLIFTTEQADSQRVRELEAHAGQVIVAGDNSVSGEQLVQAMAGLGYQTIYSASGPKVLHLLLTTGVLDRLYLTLGNRMLGGDPFSSIVEGPLLAPAVGMRLHTAYHDDAGLDGLGQLFLCYDRPG
ncbi:MAG TPA: dihydrofolate reductase family protein [Anaerolineae bacterium]|nr:dihydrofolate reductase family protein [Anaerolineae bacterium]